MRVEGSLIGLKYNDKVYYYIKNMQEDIIGITDENFNKIVEYEYDSWGNIITIKDNNGNIITDESHIGIINPFRYRSYYYDKETKLYYLNSRYYNPEWGRFINCDSYLGVSEDILGYNLYIYVSNNPINNSDNTGQFLKKAWNWVKKKANQVKKTITKSVNAVKKVAKKAKEAFVFEGEIGYGIGGEAGIGVVSVKAEATKTFGYSYSNKESKQYTSTSAGVGVTIIDYSLSASIDIRNYDNGTGNPMAMPWEIYNDENTFVDPNLGVSKELGTLEKSGSGGRFIGINFGAFLLIGGKIKIGFNF